MNSFTKKGFVQKIIIVLVFLTLFNFMYPYMPVFADEEDDQSTMEAVGGVLINPLLSLFVTLAEASINTVQKMLGLGQANYHIDTNENFWSGLVGWATGAAAVVGSIIITGGLAFIPLVLSVGVGYVSGTITAEMIPDDFYLPNYLISPQEIFAGTIPALDVDFINPHYAENEEGEQLSSAAILQPVISKWYVAIRNVVLVALMIVLLYIGIRIVISTTASEKAKYQENIKNWLVALIILVFMHYIMAFALSITEYITQIMHHSAAVITFPIELEGFGADVQQQITENEALVGQIEDGVYNFRTNLMGAARLNQQFIARDENQNQVFTWDKVGYTIIYLCLVFYTLMFLIIYFKRVIYMAFLTVIAPLVALTYPIDKMGDGSAQAFNMWLKEYLFNLLLQPFHLLLYTLLISSVIDLAATNMLYAIVALGFLLQGEKLLRKFFGFEKASTTGTIMGSAVGGAMAMQAVNQIGKLKNLGSGRKSKDGSSSSQDNNSNSRIRTSDSGTTDELMRTAFGTTPSEGGPTGGGSTGGGSTGGGPTGGGPTGGGPTGGGPTGGGPTGGGPTGGGPTGGGTTGGGTTGGGSTAGGSSKGKPTKFGAFKAKVNRGARKVIKSPVGAATKTAMHYTGKVGKKVPRLALGVAGAVALGTVGVAAGLVSDDYSNVLKWGGAAAGVGGALGNSAANLGERSVSSTPGALKSLKNTYQENRYDQNQLKAKQNEVLDKEWEKDRKTKQLYKQKFGEDYKKKMEEAKEYRKYGVTDDNSIMAAINLKDKDPSITKEEGIAYAKIASAAKTDKELEDYSKRLKDNGIDEAKIAQIKSNVRKMNEP